MCVSAAGGCQCCEWQQQLLCYCGATGTQMVQSGRACISNATVLCMPTSSTCTSHSPAEICETDTHSVRCQLHPDACHAADALLPLSYHL